MSMRYEGGIISATPPTLVAGAGASGAWTLEQQMQAIAAGLWPVNGPFYIEDVFSTWLYTGNGSTQTITNGIDLAGKGGLVWIKNRQTSIGVPIGHILTDTARGVTKFLRSQSTSAQETSASSITAFNSSGFSFGSDTNINYSGDTYASWTFRQQPKFFTCGIYTGNGASNRVITHDLGSAPGCIIVKNTTYSGASWNVYHRSLSADQVIYLNATSAAGGTTGIRDVTSTTFTLGATDEEQNYSGHQFVYYAFAHNAGGFGLSGTDNVISCGSWAGNGSTQDISLGYEPQWILLKNVTRGYNWVMSDVMRSMDNTNSNWVYANTAAAEETNTPSYLIPTATGFKVNTATPTYNASGDTYIYIAIRRGPMKVPTDGTKVFIPVTATPSGATTVTTNFPVDLAINAQRDAGTSGNKVFWDRLRGSSTAAGQGLFSNLTNAEVSYSGNGIGLQSNTTIVDNYWNTLNGATTPVIYWNFRRAPSFFDEVCYTGTGVDLTVNHNLGVVPEWVIIKNRSRAGTNWSGAYFANASEYYDVRLNQDIGRSLITMGPLGPTLISNSATTFGVYGGSTLVNYSGDTYVAYLFATCAGVSKVGTYTGTATTLQINCGFTAGARFVLIKRTDSTGDWYVWDSARGIVAGNDPYLLLNSTAAEVTSTDYIDTYSAGFEISSTAPAAINASGGSYIFLAIA